MRNLFFLCLVGCGSSQILDDVAPDASFDATTDATMDATKDAIADATMDATTDATMDATTDATNGEAGAGTYSAYGIIGGLDRVRIAKTVGNTCFYIQLVSPSMNKGNLTLPNNWGFEAARALQPAAACNPKYLGPITNMFDATSQSGTIQFVSNGIPQTIQSVMATINYANNPMWCPPSETFSATNIPVQ